MIDPARWRALDATARSAISNDQVELTALTQLFMEWQRHVYEVSKRLNSTLAQKCLADALDLLDSAQVDGVSAARSALDQAYADLGLGPDEAQHALGLTRVG